jgi:hypothetical protein
MKQTQGKLTRCDQQNVFVVTSVCYNQPKVTRMKPKSIIIVGFYKQNFVTTKFVITKFVITELFKNKLVKNSLL